MKGADGKQPGSNNGNGEVGNNGKVLKETQEAEELRKDMAIEDHEVQLQLEEAVRPHQPLRRFIWRASTVS